ncbi:MAG: phosphoserine phosphatase SerB [Pseudomonadota bacterium]|nr:phosphoserine phosphatase SerB [Pseudomonadota bacterium]
MNSVLGPEYVVTLVASTPGGLVTGLVRDAAIHLRKSGGKGLRTSWLAEAEAADIFCTGFSGEQLRPLLLNHLQDAPLDILIQPASTRRKKLLVADMESTIIEEEMLDELAAVIGCGDAVAAITRRAMNGEIDFEGALRARIDMLKGQPTKLLDEVAERMTITEGARELVAGMKAQGAVCWLVTGGFTWFAEAVAAKLGFDRAYANTLVLENNVITGGVMEPILDRHAKKMILEKACAELGLTLQDTLTVGDGANDVPMLTACSAGGGLGVAYRAKPNVRAVIANQVNHTSLKTLLYAQG